MEKVISINQQLDKDDNQECQAELERQWLEDFVQEEIDHRIYLYQRSRTIDTLIVLLLVIAIFQNNLFAFVGALF